MKSKLPAWGMALVACVPLLAVAQSANSTPPKQSSQLSYRSAFADYKPWQDPRPGDWKAMNDAVGKSGGHGMHMHMPMSDAFAPVDAASKPPMNDHKDHQIPMPGSKK